MPQILDGHLLATKIEEELFQKISHHCSLRPPGLAFIRIGDDPASITYIQKKQQKCQEVGILSFDRELPADISEKTAIEEIIKLNHNPAVDGILVQLPLPASLSPTRILSHIDPQKDVDGFHPLNMGKLLLGETSGFIPCTPLGIKTLLFHALIPLQGKHAVIMGRSNIVGKPLAALLMQKVPGGSPTVTVAHSQTANLKEMARSADILIAAIGKPHTITADMVKKGAVVIDVGINRLPSPTGRSPLVGDVDYDKVAPLCSYITPVPRGIGPMTIAMLLTNVFLSYCHREKLSCNLSYLPT